MNKIKRTSLLVIVLILTLVLCSCGSKTTYKVTYFLDGEEYRVLDIVENEKAPDLEVDSIKYEFYGWELNGEPFDFNTPIISNLYLNGETTDKEYKVVFKNYDGTTLRSNKYGAYEDIVSPINPSRPSDEDFDYTFIGWDQEFSKAISDLTINAVYSKSIRKYNVTVYNADGSVYLSDKIEKGTKLNLPAATKATDSMYSYTFNKWVYSDGEVYDSNVGVDRDGELKAVFKKSPEKELTDGMTFSFVGDSISTFYAPGSEMNSYYSGTNEFFYPYYSNMYGFSTVQKTWWYQLIKKCNGRLGINNSLSGSVIDNNGNESSTVAACNDARLDTLGENGDPDIIVTFIGTNDLVSLHSPERFRYAYNRMLTKINEKYPNAYVFCVTFGYSSYNSYETYRADYNNIIFEVCENYGATVIDWQKIQTEETYRELLLHTADVQDRLHFGESGMTAMANLCYETITKYFNKELD